MPQNLPGFARCFTGNCISTGSLENPAGDQINMFPDILMNYINSTVQKNMFVFVFSFFLERCHGLWTVFFLEHWPWVSSCSQATTRCRCQAALSTVWPLLARSWTWRWGSCLEKNRVPCNFLPETESLHLKRFDADDKTIRRIVSFGGRMASFQVPSVFSVMQFLWPPDLWFP